MIRAFLGLLAITFMTANSYAAVWTDNQVWSVEWERKYGEWMNTDAVHKRLFVGKESKYYGIIADCADASYALRAIFSLENSLPFKIINPSGSRSSKYKYLTNRTNKFDSAGASSRERLIKMINYLGLSVGTEHLSHHDTHPVKIASVDAGMLFTYKIKARFRKTIRHSYNIKKVTEFGDFDVIYSTQAIAKKNLEMKYRKGHSFSNLPHGAWGFRRFKWPQHEGISNRSLPPETAYSNEQYKLVNSLGKKFFRHVKNALKRTSESPERMLKRSLSLLCIESRDRIEYVDQGYKHHVSTRAKCMNYADYDAYSTPARDAALKSSYERFSASYEEVISNGLGNEVDFKLLEMSKGIVKGVKKGTQVETDLYELCSINYREGKTIHMSELYRRIKNNTMSSHPNDKLPQRWGETQRNRTKCKVWY